MKWEKSLIQSRVGEGGQDLGPICGPGKRWGHTCNAIRGGKLLYVFGGYGKENCPTNQVHVFDTATRTWSEPVMKGTPPLPRDSHTCTTVGDNLFVFGGTDGRNTLNDLHILDTSTNTWMSPSVRGEGPVAREGHGAALVGKRLFIFGGRGKSSNNFDEEHYGDLYILNTETFVWQHAVTSGIPPPKRDDHTCASWKNKLIVIGGKDTNEYYLSDVHILDADTLVWTKLSTSGQILPPRAGHAAIAFGKNLFVFGGFSDESTLYDDIYMLDVDTGVWTKVIATGEGPSPRFSMSGDSLDPKRSGVLVLFGGCNKDLEALDDMYYLHTGLMRENKRDERRFEKLSLRKQLKLKCQEQSMLASSVSNKVPVITETKNDLCQPISTASTESCKPNLREYLPFPGKRTFQAKVTKCFPVGYSIETVIDGKLLRGVLFSNKSLNSNDDGSKRLKGAVEINGVKMNVDQKSFSETPQPVSQDKPSDRQADSVHEENVEAASAPNMKSPACSLASQPDEAPRNLNLPVPADNVENLNLAKVADGNMEGNKTQNETNTSNDIHEVNTSPAAMHCDPESRQNIDS